MCGIAGFNFNDNQLIEEMNNSQVHRGPDGGGIYVDDYVSMGHRRLAIIDLSKEANQPMHYKHFVIVFNGEIYNFKVLRKELEKREHEFSTNSDTEVVLHAFEEWGEDCLNKFNGMWAFSLYDQKKQELFLSRDRFGIKPLFYHFKNGKFIFSSEIKAIQCHPIELSINVPALNYYFYQKYIGAGETIFTEVQKLEEAHYLRFDLNSKKLVKKKYYHLEQEIEKANLISTNEKKEKITELIHDSVEDRLIADVPVGSFLSGGVDSSVISASIAKNHPNLSVFSIGFKEHTFNELEYAKLVAEKIKARHYYQTLEIKEDFIFDIINRMDEPFGDSSLIPTSLLSKITKEKVTVSLSGDAGDEVFGGYDTYLAWKLSRFIPGIIIRGLKPITKLFPTSDKNLHLSFKIKKFVQDWTENVQTRHLNWLSQTTVAQREKILGKNYLPINSFIKTSSETSLLSIQLNDFKNYLSNDILRKVDMASMLYSLETRVPFLDYRLVPLVLSLNDNQKIRGLQTKYFFKKIALNLIPKKIIKRKKAGFSVPLSVWFKESVKMQEVINNNGYFTHNMFSYEYAQELLQEHLKNKNDNSRILWLIFVFNLWYKNQNGVA